MPSKSRKPKSGSTSTIRAGWLGARVRELREARGMKMTEVADLIGKTQATISRLETGEFPITSDVLLTFLDLYGVHDRNQRRELVELAEDIAQRGWWDGFRPHMSAAFADFVWLENRAHTMHTLEVNAVPGLLQTPEYATELISNGPQQGDDLQVRRLVEARLLRSDILTRTNGPEFRFLIAEAALLQVVGNHVVMAAQLTKILEWGERPNIEVRVLPAEKWSHAAATVGGGYTIFDLETPFPDVTCIDTPAGAIYVETPDIDFFVNSYDAIWADALDAADTAARIALRAKDIAG